MKIYREGIEIELTKQEIVAAWIEHQSKIDASEREGYAYIIKSNIQQGNFVYDTKYEADIIEEITDLIWSDVKRRGVDADWALGTEEYCNGCSGFLEYFYEAMRNLGLERI